MAKLRKKSFTLKRGPVIIPDKAFKGINKALLNAISNTDFIKPAAKDKNNNKVIATFLGDLMPNEQASKKLKIRSTATLNIKDDAYLVDGNAY